MSLRPATPIASLYEVLGNLQQETLALASMALDEPPASSTASSTAAAMRGKVGLHLARKTGASQMQQASHTCGTRFTCVAYM